MSTLDKAFIKAFAKDTASPNLGGAGAAAESRDAGHGHTVNDGHAPLPGGPHEYDSAHRADGSHHGYTSQLHAPHVYFPPPAAYAVPAYVNPHYESLPHAISSAFQGQHVVPPVPVAPPPPVNTAVPAPAGIMRQAPPLTGEPITAQPPPADYSQGLAAGWTTPLSNEEAKETLQAAASLKLPQPLGLPSAFEALADEAHNQLEAESFSPDWEVDRFAWPDICEGLLQAEDGYFHHVGVRLKTATDNGRHVLMITGSRRGEGRTTLALCLARCAAEAGVKVALVDADLKNPQLGTRLGMDTPCSWQEVIVGKAPLNETAVASIEDRLTLFPLARSEYVDMPDKRLTSLLNNVSRHYPLVIVDVGPLEAEDPQPFSGADTCPVDAAIVVRDMRSTTGQKTAVTARKLQESGIQAVGIAENFGPL